ncbi:MAG: ribose 5-phosphate isomerase B [Pyrinomonadaceae bacterium]
MRIAIGADHGGFPLNEQIIVELKRTGHEVLDFGTHDGAKPDDYPDYARLVGESLQSGEAERGILICGSGVGICVAANKLRGVRACLCHDTYSAHQGVEHDHLNALCLGARIVGVELAFELVRAFLSVSFTGEDRHVRRLQKVAELEEHFTAGEVKAK